MVNEAGQGRFSSARRRLWAGSLAALAGGLATRVAGAFPRSAIADFQAASKLLGRYGLTVSGRFAGELRHDVLAVDVRPREDVQFDYIVNEVDSGGVIAPCVKTSVFQGVSEFTHYEEGGIIPCVRVELEGDVSTITHYEENGIDPGWVTVLENDVTTFTHYEDGSIVPCVRVELEGDVSTITHYEENGIDPCWVTVLENDVTTFTHFVEGTIVPCLRTTLDEIFCVFEIFERGEPVVRVDLEEERPGERRPVAISVSDPDAPVTITVGRRTWALRGGELVEITG